MHFGQETVMDMRWMRWGLFCALVGLGLAARSADAEPWNRWLLKRVEADPEKRYELTEAQGPWMIMAASFSGEGEGPEQQAHTLILEIRKRFHVPAYLYDKAFDYSEKIRTNRLNQYGDPVVGKYRRGGTYREYAVLVGDFPRVDHADAQALLKKLKYSEIECMRLDGKKQDYAVLGGLRIMQREINRLAGHGHEVNAKRGPLGHAFLTTNPLLPDDYFRPKGLDSTVLRMNEHAEYSLLKCPGKYTVQVATFTGKIIIDPKKIRELEKRGTDDRELARESQLADAADKANRLAKALRDKGEEAYEFHDRNQSIVTIGSFQEIGTPGADGRIQLLPGIVRIMQKWGASMDPSSGNVGTPKQIAGIPLDIQATLVQVPERSLAADYQAPAWRLFRK